MVNTIPEVYAIPVSEQYDKLLESLSLLSFDWFPWLQLTVPNDCLGDFGTRLSFHALLPLVPLAVYVGGGAVVAAIKAHRDPDGDALGAAQSAALAKLPSTLTVLFALVPGVSSRIFSTFSCIEFGYDDSASKAKAFIFADLKVECAGSEYGGLVGLAVGMIVIWPMGVPTLFSALLYMTRGGEDEKRPKLKRAVNFLRAEYRPECASYWEVPPCFAEPIQAY